MISVDTVLVHLESAIGTSRSKIEWEFVCLFSGKNNLGGHRGTQFKSCDGKCIPIGRKSIRSLSVHRIHMIGNRWWESFVISCSLIKRNGRHQLLRHFWSSFWEVGGGKECIFSFFWCPDVAEIRCAVEKRNIQVLRWSKWQSRPEYSLVGISLGNFPINLLDIPMRKAQLYLCYSKHEGNAGE